MHSLNEIVQTYSSEEQTRFIQYLSKKNKRPDNKNIQLFKLLSEAKWTSSQICQKLYKTETNGAYHALRKRLFKSLMDFSAQLAMDNENHEDIEIIKYVLAARNFLLHNKTKLAFKLLEKAESQAQDALNYSLLNEIYHTQIQYAHTLSVLDLDLLIEKFKKNQSHLRTEEELNIAYAKMRCALSQFNYKGSVINFEVVFESSLRDQDLNFESSMSLKSLYQFMALSSMQASVTKNHYAIERFLIKNYLRIRELRAKDKHLFYHIEIVYMIANTLFRNKKFSESLSYLDKMHTLMLGQNKKHFKRFQLKNEMLKALNNNYSGKHELAIKQLEQIKDCKHADIETLLDVHLSLTMFYFQQNELGKAKGIYASFYHTDAYYIERAGTEWVIKKNLMEILLHIELQHLDLAESRIRSFRRSYSQFLKSIKQERVLIYLKLAEEYFKNTEIVESVKFQRKIEASFDWLPLEYEDIFVMSFYAWLKSKMDLKPIYNTTLDLIRRSASVN